MEFIYLYFDTSDQRESVLDISHIAHLSVRYKNGIKNIAHLNIAHLFVTGYWKIDHNVTLGQLHFIGPANSHTHALSMHCCITGLS